MVLVKYNLASFQKEKNKRLSPEIDSQWWAVKFCNVVEKVWIEVNIQCPSSSSAVTVTLTFYDSVKVLSILPLARVLPSTYSTFYTDKRCWCSCCSFFNLLQVRYFLVRSSSSSPCARCQETNCCSIGWERLLVLPGMKKYAGYRHQHLFVRHTKLLQLAMHAMKTSCHFAVSLSRLLWVARSPKILFICSWPTSYILLVLTKC